MLPDLTAFHSAVSEVNGTAEILDCFEACGPLYPGFGDIVNAPVVLLNDVSVYGPSTTFHSGLVA